MAQIFPQNPDLSDPRRAALIRTLATLPDEWTLLCDRRIGYDARDAVDAVLVHPKIGIALVDLAPANPTEAVDALDEHLAHERFARYFPGDLPIVGLSVAADDIIEIGECLAAAFDAAPRLSIQDMDWADAVIEALLADGETVRAKPVGQEPTMPKRGVSVIESDNCFDADGEAAIAGGRPPRMEDGWHETGHSVPRRGRLIAAAAVIVLILGLGAGAWEVEQGGSFTIQSPAPGSLEVQVMYRPWAATQAATTLEAPHPSAPPVQLVAKSLDDPAPTPPLPTVVEPLPQPADTATETAVSRAPSDSASAPSHQATGVHRRQRSQHKPRREVERGAPEPQAVANEAPRRALDTTNLRELASAASTVIGEVRKGSTFRVIGRSDDGKWLKIETRDGLTGYYWAARAREMR